MFWGTGRLQKSEAQIQNEILHYLNWQKRHWAYAVRPSGMVEVKNKIVTLRPHTDPWTINGLADIQCHLRNVPGLKGVVVFFEVKSKKGKQSTDQIKFEMQVNRSGGYYFVVRSIEEAETALKSIGA